MPPFNGHLNEYTREALCSYNLRSGGVEERSAAEDIFGTTQGHNRSSKDRTTAATMTTTTTTATMTII